MFGKIIYLSDDVAYLENKVMDNLNDDLLNVHLIFESGNQKVLGEISEVDDKKIVVHFLGEFIDNRYYSGIIRKASVKSTIRVINSDELKELIGVESASNFKMGESSIYAGFNVYPGINDLFANHMCIFGNSGSGKSCGTARLVQNILQNVQAPAYNSCLLFFDSFGEYKNAFSNIKSINPMYSYKFITSEVKEQGDNLIKIPINLLTIDDLAVLLQADKHSQLTILERALKYARIFALNNEDVIKIKNNIIAKAIINVLYSTNTTKQKKDNIFSIIDTCSTKNFELGTVIEGLGYSRTFSECFIIDSKGHFGEEVLINEYILKFIDSSLDDFEEPSNVTFSLKDFAKALEFTLISEGFDNNKSLQDDAQLLKVRLNTIIHNKVGTLFDGNAYASSSMFINYLTTNVDGKRSQIVNINLEGLDDIYAKAIVKVYTHILFEFAKNNAARGVMPYHIFLEEAHRYVQKDNDVYLLGYNIFERIAKEGRKYGIILDIISQRPVEISETVVSQCSNFLIFKMTNATDVHYIEEMLPNITKNVIDKMKVLQPGTCVAFGTAFKIPSIIKMEMPNPRPYSASCDVASFWNANTSFTVTGM